MATTINLYTISADPREINKTLPTAINGNTPIQLYLRDDSTDILTPEVSFPYSDTYAAANYAFISPWNRYYFVEGMRVTPAGRLYLQLRIDVLKTYAAGILAAPVNIIRSQSAGINEVHDDKLPLAPDRCAIQWRYLPSPFTQSPIAYNTVIGVFNSQS